MKEIGRRGQYRNFKEFVFVFQFFFFCIHFISSVSVCNCPSCPRKFSLTYVQEYLKSGDMIGFNIGTNL
jgi:hypothetical protein